MKYHLTFKLETTSSDIKLEVSPYYCTIANDNLLNIVNKEYTPSQGDKLYFLPGVNIPRVKLKDLTLQYKIKSVRNIDEATHVFGGAKSVAKLTSTNWKYLIPTDKFKTMFEQIQSNMDLFYVENVREVLEHYTEEYLLCDYDAINHFKYTENTLLRTTVRSIPDFMMYARSSSLVSIIEDSHKDLFPGIMSLEIYDESEIIKHINGDDAVVIDETMFTQLSDMFKSSDTDNHILAMEIMANSNYIDSLLYIELLFKEHSHQMSNCRTKNHVNFKSLLSYLGKNKNYMETSIDNIVESLINKDQVSTDKLDIILNRYSWQIENRGDSKYFKVKTVTLDEELLKSLNTNYTYTVSEDYVPEIDNNLDDLNSTPGVAGVAPEVEEVQSDLEISDDDIETALLRVERNELKSELVALEESIKDQEEESNNNQIEEKDGGDGFEWF